MTRYVGTLDNDATTTEIQSLARAGYREAVLRGLDYIFAAQFPNGRGPQVWPLEGDYHDAITFDDGAVTQTLELLQEVADGKDQFAFVPASVRAKARASMERSIEKILATQISENSKRTVWAQQHNALNLQAVAGRNYEPAAECASESASKILFLMKLPQPKPEVVAAVHSAAAWFRKTAIHGVAFERGTDGRRLIPTPGAGPIWARYYEIGSDRPTFGDRDKSIHDDVNELSLERRNRYSWYNAAPAAALDRFAVWSAAHP
jgi:PelA/Pel-15E family pectate lyase